MNGHNLNPETMHGTLRWVLESAQTPEWEIANLLVRELDSEATSAVELIASKQTSLAVLVGAKRLFKTLRLEGETADDRHLGSQLYACAIAAALVHHNEFISRQRDESLRRAMERIADDYSMPPALRSLADMAAKRLGRAA